MRPQLLASTMNALLNINRNVLIEGPPGMGKTEIVKQVCSQRPRCHVVFRHAPTMQPEDLALPFRGENGRLDFLKAGWLPMATDFRDGDEVVVIVDELPQADNAIQKTMANMLQEKEVYGDKLWHNVTFVCTGNRASDRAGANRILSHLRGRMTTLEFEPHLDDWCAWALDAGVRSEVISFLRFKPGLLADFDAQRDINPTPRNWTEGVSPVIDNVPAEAEYECFKGAVGEGPSSEFVAFLKICRKLPDPDAVLLDPKNAPVPTDPATLYAIAGAVAYRASQTNAEAVLTYARRLPAEFTVLVARDAVKRDTGFTKTRAFIDWMSKEGQHVLL
jgi:hypothetical protein